MPLDVFSRVKDGDLNIINENEIIAILNFLEKKR